MSSDQDPELEERVDIDSPEFMAAFAETVYNGKSINWRYWVHQMPVLTAVQAARLLVGLDPDLFENLDNRPNKNDPSHLCDRARSIQRLAEAEEQSSLSPDEWMQWADSHGFSVHVGYRLEIAASVDLACASGHTALRDGISCNGVPKNEIVAREWPLLNRMVSGRTFTQSSLAAALSDVPKWLEVARVAQGAPGKASALWSPALIASCLADKGYADIKALTHFIRGNFPDWIAEWQEIKATMEER